MAVQRKKIWLALIGVLTSFGLSGCTGVMGEPVPGSQHGAPGLDFDFGEGTRAVRVFDIEGTRQAIGVAGIDEPDVVSGSDGVIALKLAVVDIDTRTVSWPIGERRVLDAALGPRSGEVAYIAIDGLPCAGSFGATPFCANARAVPHGMDLGPDGQVVFVADSGIGTNIWIVDPHSLAPPRQLTTGVQMRDRPIIDPTGTSVVFVSASAGGLASLFQVSVAGGALQQLTNVGLELGPIGSEDRIPADHIPPPTARSTMRWTAMGLQYDTVGSTWSVDPDSGDAREEVLR